MILSDEELSARVMELRGWKRSVAIQDTYFVNGVEYNGMIQAEEWARGNTVMSGTPGYLHDIAAAWELTDYLPQLVITKLIGRWRVEWFDGAKGREIEGESLPLAITRAFILEKDDE